MSASELTHALFLLVKTAGFYGREAAETRRRQDEASAEFKRALAAAAAVELAREEDDLFFDTRPILPSAARDFLAQRLKALGVDALVFSRGFDVAGLEKLSAALQPGGAGRELDGVPFLRVVRGEEAPAEEAPASPAEDGHVETRRVFKRALTAVQTTMSLLREGKPADFAPARAAVDELMDRCAKDPKSLLEMTMLRDYDQYTFAHSVNVSVYAISIGLELGLSKPLLAELGFAALFHDVGKVRLPVALIEKPGELDRDEWTRLRRHPALGALVLLGRGSGLDRAWARAVAVAFEHHLRYDGMGYPTLHWPRRQSLFARICAIADSFDAMTSGRVYERRALAPGEALRRLERGEAAAYDPDLVRLFADAVEGRIVAPV